MTCKAPVKMSPPTNSNQHPVFTRRMPFLLPSQQCQSTEGKIYHVPQTPNSPGVFQLCRWPLKAPSCFGEGGLPCLSSAFWRQYPILTTDCCSRIIFSFLMPRPHALDWQLEKELNKPFKVCFTHNILPSRSVLQLSTTTLQPFGKFSLH